tara:strand:- start:1762 stop:2304 length:543 start_codon:yes stop_codon:yes gene_type:complete
MDFNDYNHFLKESNFKSGFEYFKDVQKNKKSEFEQSVDDYCAFLNVWIDDEVFYYLALREQEYGGEYSPFYIEWMEDLYASDLSTEELIFTNPDTLEEEKTLYDDRIDNLFSGDDFRITEVYENDEKGTIIFSYDFCPKLSDYYSAMMKAASKVSEDAYPPTFNLEYDTEDKEFNYPAYF